MNRNFSSAQPAEAAAAKPQADAVIVDSRRLFGACREILIEHQGDTYRLQITRNGKLILIK
ncbi:hemin uptake protein HemP [uncultured Aquitalea sp.]|uniref:hemin uptake protein HemP n=1 Tax=uncultured Aquitalea sp. TaxID=540272 RepID=UPI0025CFDB27|nr:hemin uptake protein HemP [uncultured Aquitalea sp.]